jgi:hypothetical protein
MIAMWPPSIAPVEAIGFSMTWFQMWPPGDRGLTAGPCGAMGKNKIHLERDGT